MGGGGVGGVGDAMNSDTTMHQHQQDHHHHEEVDAWHDHSHDAVRPQQAHTEKVNGPLVIGVGSVLFLLIVATVIVTYQYYNWYVTRLHDQSIAAGSQMRTKFIAIPEGSIDYAHRSERTQIKELLSASSPAVVVPEDPAGGSAFIQLPENIASERALRIYEQNRK